MIDKNMNTYVEQAMDTFVRHSLMSDEFLDFVKDNTKPLDSLMAYYRCAIMEVETKFKVLNEQFSLEYDRNPIESIKTRVKSMDGIIKKVKALFVIGIGHKLSDGISQDGRAFDYDDWNLNGDLFVYNDLLDNALELSSMGIRVDKEAIINQAKLSSNEDKLNLEYQQKIINEEVPFTLGGGIGQSRLCMYFLNKLHVGEVQSSYWDESTREFFLSKGITLL